MVAYPSVDAAWVCVRWARARGVPVIVDVLDTWPDVLLLGVPRALGGLGRRVLWSDYARARTIFRGLRYCAAVSKSYLGFARGLAGKRAGFEGERVYYLGCDASRLGWTRAASEDLRRRGIGEKGKNVTFLGTLGRSYDIRSIVRAAARVGKTLPEAKFVIAGDGPAGAQLRAEAKSMGVQNVVFTGLLRADVVGTLLEESGVGLLAYADDAPQSVPTKAGEYLAFGLPVISSLRGEFEEMVRAEGIGLAYRSGDAESLAGAVSQLMGDSSMLSSCRERARSVFERQFRAGVIYPDYAEWVEGIVRASRGGR